MSKTEQVLDNNLKADYYELKDIKSSLIDSESYELIRFVDTMISECQSLISLKSLDETKYSIFKIKMCLLRSNSLITDLK